MRWTFLPWWRHQMETFTTLLAICAGKSPVPVHSPHKGKRHGPLMFSLICAWLNSWVNNREAGDLIRHRAHYDVIVMRPVLSKSLRTPAVTRVKFQGVCVWLYVGFWQSNNYQIFAHITEGQFARHTQPLVVIPFFKESPQTFEFVMRCKKPLVNWVPDIFR